MIVSTDSGPRNHHQYRDFTVSDHMSSHSLRPEKATSFTGETVDASVGPLPRL